MIAGCGFNEKYSAETKLTLFEDDPYEKGIDNTVYYAALTVMTVFTVSILPLDLYNLLFHSD